MKVWTKISKKTQASSQSLYNRKRKYISDSLNEQIQKDKLKTNNEIDSLKEEISKLQKDIYQLKMEKDILKRAAELIKKNRALILMLWRTKKKQLLSMPWEIIIHRRHY